MAYTVYPAGTDTNLDPVEVNSEQDRQVTAHGGRMATHVVDPAGGDYSLTTSGSSYDVDVAPGTAFISGHLVSLTATETVTVNGSVTSDLFLVVDDAKTDNAALVAQDQSASNPTGQYVVKLHTIASDGSGVTSTTDLRPWVAYRQDAAATSITGLQTGSVSGLATDSMGAQSTTVQFARAYQTAVDSVQVYLDSIQGGLVTNEHATSITQSGFTLNYNVVNAGSSGDTATFGYAARGQ